MKNTDKPVTIGTYQYLSKVDHRDGTPTKSQWTVPISDEYASFSLGVDSGWISDTAAWSLHLVDGLATYLGRSAQNPGPVAQLCVAYFQLAALSHGYPSDPARSIREVPPNEVRSDWLAKRYMRPAVIRKLGRGLVCKL